MTFDFEHQRQEWSKPPVDDVGYIPSAQLLNLSDAKLRDLIEEFERVRYQGWRNSGNLWREHLGLDKTLGKTVLDFGCGVGIEALQFARTGNQVVLADIVPENVFLATRVLKLNGFKPVAQVFVSGDGSFYESLPVDIFYSNGVLHHTPHIEGILRRACLLGADEIRLMLYSDLGWQEATGTPIPPWDENVTTNPAFGGFVRFFDGVGDYADWYSEEKIRNRFGDFLDVKGFHYITDDSRYCVVTLTPP